MPPKSHLPKVQTIVDEAACNNLIYMAKTHRSPPAKNRDSAEIFGGRVARIEREGSNLRLKTGFRSMVLSDKEFNNHRSFLWIFIPKPQRAQLKSQSSNHQTSTFCLWLIPWSATSHCQVLTFSVSIHSENGRPNLPLSFPKIKVIACVSVLFQWLMTCHGFVKTVLLLMEDIPGM